MFGSRSVSYFAGVASLALYGVYKLFDDPQFRYPDSLLLFKNSRFNLIVIYFPFASLQLAPWDMSNVENYLLYSVHAMQLVLGGRKVMRY